MEKQQYSDEFKEQLIRECIETGNVALVARKHEISPNTIHSWLKKQRKRGSTKALPKAKDNRYKEMEKWLKEVSTENDELKRMVADKELELAVLRDLTNTKNPPIAGKVAIANRWIEKGYNKSIILGFVGLTASTYYYNISKEEKQEPKTPKKNTGREIPGYSLTETGEKVSDEQIKEHLSELIAGDGFPYGYKKLTISLKEDHNLLINHKKVYRLCKELDILRPQRKIYPERPRKLAKRNTITGSGQLWQMDLKYGYIDGTGQFFFQLSIIDVFDRTVVGYHLGLSAKAKDACRILEEALRTRGFKPGMKLPVIRTDNGPQFTAKRFEKTCSKWQIKHERIPVKTPNLNAYIESFHAILEDDCYKRHEFQSFAEVYQAVTEYMDYYNNRRRHSSINYKAPNEFYKLVSEGQIKALALRAA
ncbi:MAG: IS3 family transposase [Clostridiales bacterium]|nr:IS3 family transposase [Clostridiales bacterium]MCF8022465.1 IS3 family transposase [Clostridiales bacterium]